MCESRTLILEIFISRHCLAMRVHQRLSGVNFEDLSPQIRTLRLKLLSSAAAEGRLATGTRNQLRMYLTMSIAAAQPVLMYWLTYHLVR